MLFDLRGRGRKNTVKVIYLFLAVLMGGGLVLFGIGGQTNGGLVDAITGNGGSGGNGSARYVKQERAARAAVQANPRDEQAWVELVRARSNLARTTDGFNATTGTFDAAGKKRLREAVQAWEGYQATNPKNAELQSQAGNLAFKAYATLNDRTGAVDALEIVAKERNAAGPYAKWAAVAYEAGQTRKGDLATKKALSLADADRRPEIRSQLQQAKQQAQQQAGAASPTPAPPK